MRIEFGLPATTTAHIHNGQKEHNQKKNGRSRPRPTQRWGAKWNAQTAEAGSLSRFQPKEPVTPATPDTTLGRRMERANDTDREPEPAAEEGYIWDVQEILAERPSISTDENEVLVVWKTAWIQKRCLIADCPAMRRWNEAAKWASCEDCCGQASLQVVLPVEPGSRMATDLAEARASQARMSAYWRRVRHSAARRAAADVRGRKASRIEVSVSAGEPAANTEKSE
jgi:hypothetical protein